MKNSSADRDPAQWLVPSSGEIPPVAFAIPVYELDGELLLMAPEEPQKQERFLLEYVRAELTARYGTAVKQLEAAAEAARAELEILQDRRRQLIHELKATAHWITDIVINFPAGWLQRAWLILLILVTVGLGLSEWVNVAGYAARRETFNMFTAMSFTGIIAIAALALELHLPRRVVWLMRGIGTFLYLAGILAGVFFFWNMATVFVAPEPSLNALIQGIDANGSAGVVATPDKRPLFFCQVLAGIAAGLSFVSAISRGLVRTEKAVPNPTRREIENELRALNHEIAQVDERQAHATGGLEQFQASIITQKNVCQGQLHALKRNEEKLKAYREFLRADAEAARQQPKLPRSNHKLNHQLNNL